MSATVSSVDNRVVSASKWSGRLTLKVALDPNISQEGLDPQSSNVLPQIAGPDLGIDAAVNRNGLWEGNPRPELTLVPADITATNGAGVNLTHNAYQWNHDQRVTRLNLNVHWAPLSWVEAYGRLPILGWQRGGDNPTLAVPTADFPSLPVFGGGVYDPIEEGIQLSLLTEELGLAALAAGEYVRYKNVMIGPEEGLSLRSFTNAWFKAGLGLQVGRSGYGAGGKYLYRTGHAGYLGGQASSHDGEVFAFMRRLRVAVIRYYKERIAGSPYDVINFSLFDIRMETPIGRFNFSLYDKFEGLDHYNPTAAGYRERAGFQRWLTRDWAFGLEYAFTKYKTRSDVGQQMEGIDHRVRAGVEYWY